MASGVPEKSPANAVSISGIVSAFVKLCISILMLISDITACVMVHIGRHFDLEIPTSCISVPRRPEHPRSPCDSCSQRAVLQSINRADRLQRAAAEGKTRYADRGTLEDKDAAGRFKPRCFNCSTILSSETDQMKRMIVVGNVLHVCSQIEYNGNESSLVNDPAKCCNPCLMEIFNTDRALLNGSNPCVERSQKTYTTPDDVKDGEIAVESTSNEEGQQLKEQFFSVDNCEEDRLLAGEIGMKINTGWGMMEFQNEGSGILASGNVQNMEGRLQKQRRSGDVVELEDLHELSTEVGREVSTERNETFMDEMAFQSSAGQRGMSKKVTKMKMETVRDHSEVLLQNEKDRSCEGTLSTQIIELEETLRAKQIELSTAYAGLEKERQVAIIVDEAMALISRLQDERAALQMEFAHYQRLVGENSFCNAQDMAMLKEFLARKSKEYALEQELEFCRKDSMRERVEKIKRLGTSEQSGVSFIQRKEAAVSRSTVIQEQLSGSLHVDDQSSETDLDNMTHDYSMRKEWKIVTADERMDAKRLGVADTCLEQPSCLNEIPQVGKDENANNGRSLMGLGSSAEHSGCLRWMGKDEKVGHKSLETISSTMEQSGYFSEEKVEKAPKKGVVVSNTSLDWKG